MGKTLYEFLGVDAKADPEEISAAYLRKRAVLGDGAEDELKFVNEAYYVIGDPVRRKSYDQTLFLKENPYLYVTDDQARPFGAFHMLGLALVLTVSLGGWRYMENQREAERAKLEQAARAAAELKDLEQQRLEQAKLEQDRRAELQRIQMQQSNAMSLESSLRTEERLRQQQDLQQQREEERKRYLEERDRRLEADRLARERENDRRAAELRARQDKAELDRIYRENYGSRRY